MTHPDLVHPFEELEGVALGGAVPAGLQAHLDACPRCRSELAVLRSGRRALQAALDATDGPALPLWRGVEARLRARQRRRWAVRGGFAVAAAAAVVLAVAVRPEPAEEPELTPSAALALDRADEEYRAAISVLEARAARPAGEDSHARARAGLSLARAGAREPAARRKLLEGYAAYLKSLRRSEDE